MSSKYRKYVTHTIAVGVLTLNSVLGGCTKKSTSEAGDTTPLEVNVIQAVPETITQLGPNGQVLPGLSDIGLPGAEPVPEYLRIGMYHEIIERLQQCLMDLGLMDNDESTGYFGETAQQAVKHFQRQNKLPIDGIVNNVTWDVTMSPDAKHYAISKGTQDDDIERIQQRLYELGYLATADLVTGNFGDSTEAAVLKLQEVNGLEQDGKVGRGTISLPYGDEIKPNFLSHGEKSDTILACQERLRELRYLIATPDEAYGEDTVAAVKQFQTRNGQAVDGYLGPFTRITLSSPGARASGLILGERGGTVTKVQRLPNRRGYLVSGNVTGYYGKTTESAVRDFQSRNGLTSDGLVGVQTIAKLTNGSVGRPAANSSGSDTTTRPNNSGNSGNTGSNGDSGNTGKPPGDTTPPVSISVSRSTSILISVTSSKLGSPYVWGAKGPNSFDHSGFIYWCLNQVGANQSHLTSSGWRDVGRYTKIINFNDIQAGDITVVRSYAGITAGGGTVIDASSSNRRVAHRSLSQRWVNNFIYTWRVF